ENGNVIPLTEEHKADFAEATDSMSDKALRTLAAAYKPVERKIDSSEMEKDLILIGMVGMIDPPREEVKEAIKKAKEAGIITTMITGDHQHTAFAIAKDLGIADSLEQTTTGDEIDKFSEEEFVKKVSDYRVF